MISESAIQKEMEKIRMEVAVNEFIMGAAGADIGLYYLRLAAERTVERDKVRGEIQVRKAFEESLIALLEKHGYKFEKGDSTHD